jgi:hypothetical protein
LATSAGILFEPTSIPCLQAKTVVCDLFVPKMLFLGRLSVRTLPLSRAATARTTHCILPSTTPLQKFVKNLLAQTRPPLQRCDLQSPPSPRILACSTTPVAACQAACLAPSFLSTRHSFAATPTLLPAPPDSAGTAAPTRRDRFLGRELAT